MSDPELKDANPSTADLPGKGRTVILFIAGGAALFVLAFIGMRIRPVGLTVGFFAFFAGISMIFRRRKVNVKTALIVTAAGFLMLLSYSGPALVKGIAAYLLITGAIGLVVAGIFKAIKLSWDLGNR